MKIVNTSGKRKTAIARAVATPGTGIVKINNQLLDVYEPAPARMKIQEPLIIAGDIADKINIRIKVRGGGFISQTEAARLAIAKAIIEFTKDKKLEKKYLEYDRHLLVADVRRKEAKKPNTHGKARAKVQKSYR